MGCFLPKRLPNQEALNVVSHFLAGPSSTSEWRQNVPVPRIVLSSGSPLTLQDILKRVDHQNSLTMGGQ